MARANPSPPPVTLEKQYMRGFSLLMRFLPVCVYDVHYSGIVKYTGNGPENKGCVQSFGVMSSQVVSSRVESCRHRPCGGWFISPGLLVKLHRPLGTSV